MTPQPICISCDWLSFSVHLHLTQLEKARGFADLKAPDGFSLAELGGTNIYKRRVYILDSLGNKIVTLLLQPFSKQIPQDSMFVEVANPLLYRDEGVQWIPGLLYQIHPCDFLSLSRLDAAIDFNLTSDQTDIIKQLQHNTAYVTGKREGGQFHNFVRDVRLEQEIKQISWGHKSSDMKWKLYNKTREITETDKNGHTWITKPYIVARWRTFELDTTLDVWRLEVSLMGSSTYDWRGEKMGWHLTQPDILQAWAWDMVATRFIIRANQGHKCRKNDEVIDFLPIPPDPDRSRIKAHEGTQDKTSIEHITTLRCLVKELERVEVQHAMPICLPILDATERIIKVAHLAGYFTKVTGQTWENYRQNIEENFISTSNQSQTP